MEHIRYINTYLELINTHKGENSFVFGAGPSLWYNMRHSFFNEIKKYGITIAVNSSVIAVPDFDYWISNDSLCRRWSWWKDVKKGKGIKIVRNSWLKYKDELEDFLFFSPRPTSEGIVNSEDVGLSYCSSVPSAIDLSIQMGCRNIFVFGLDHNDDNGKDHFWQYMDKIDQPSSHPAGQGAWSQQKKVFDINLKAFSALKKFAEEKESNIYNVNFIKNNKYITKVDVFKKIIIEDIIYTLQES